ncbi:MAG: hypothetical protein ACRBN8_16380 [Nannocystales bacterium]
MNRLALCALLLAGCRSDSLPTLEHGARAIRMESALTFHEREGFTALVPPVHIPTGDPSLDQVTVWLKLGEGSITTTTIDGRSVLVFPAGTRADRVEVGGTGDQRFVADIRGTTLTPNGPRFHVFRPSAPRPTASLFGAQWPSNNAEAQAAATDYIAKRIGTSEPFDSWEPAARDAQTQAFRQKNACLPCHDPGRRENTRRGEFGLVNRGTDGSGFFTPYTLFEDESPMEQYGAHDRTLVDPLVDIVCGETIIDAKVAPGWDRACQDDVTPRARWRWDRAWETDPTRAKQRCTQAMWLFERMEPAARKQVERFFDNCANPHQD